MRFNPKKAAAAILRLLTNITIGVIAAAIYDWLKTKL